MGLHKNSHSSGKKYRRPRSWNTGAHLCSLFRSLANPRHAVQTPPSRPRRSPVAAQVRLPLGRRTCRRHVSPVATPHYAVSHSPRLRCHVLEGVKPAGVPLRDGPVEPGSSGQQELNAAVSTGAAAAAAAAFIHCAVIHFFQ